MKLTTKQISVNTSAIKVVFTNEMIQDLSAYGFSSIDIEKEYLSIIEREQRKIIFDKRKKIIDKILNKDNN